MLYILCGVYNVVHMCCCSYRVAHVTVKYSQLVAMSFIRNYVTDIEMAAVVSPPLRIK